MHTNRLTISIMLWFSGLFIKANTTIPSIYNLTKLFTNHNIHDSRLDGFVDENKLKNHHSYNLNDTKDVIQDNHNDTHEYLLFDWIFSFLNFYLFEIFLLIFIIRLTNSFQTYFMKKKMENKSKIVNLFFSTHLYIASIMFHVIILIAMKLNKNTGDYVLLILMSVLFSACTGFFYGHTKTESNKKETNLFFAVILVSLVIMNFIELCYLYNFFQFYDFIQATPLIHHYSELHGLEALVYFSLIIFSLVSFFINLIYWICLNCNKKNIKTNFN